MIDQMLGKRWLDARFWYNYGFLDIRVFRCSKMSEIKPLPALRPLHQTANANKLKSNFSLKKQYELPNYTQCNFMKIYDNITKFTYYWSSLAEDA